MDEIFSFSGHMPWTSKIDAHHYHLNLSHFNCYKKKTKQKKTKQNNTYCILLNVKQKLLHSKNASTCHNVHIEGLE